MVQLLTPSMKGVVLAILLVVGCALPAHAILRPRVPHRTRQPMNSPSFIVIPDSADSIKTAKAKK